MADADPPDEVDDCESPPDGDVDAPDARAFQEQVTERVQQHHRDHEAGTEADHPSHGRRAGQHDCADLVGHGGKRVPGFDDRSPFHHCVLFQMICHVFGALRL